ncbi:MAG: hypothetical protein AAF727_13515 [Pseudomonadota bacterium]
MARDNHIIRPERSIRPATEARPILTRQERVQLLVAQILPDVVAALEIKGRTTRRIDQRRS